MENRVEQKLEWNGKSEKGKMKQKGKNLGNGKRSKHGKNRMETWKKEIWNITVSSP